MVRPAYKKRQPRGEPNSPEQHCRAFGALSLIYLLALRSFLSDVVPSLVASVDTVGVDPSVTLYVGTGVPMGTTMTCGVGILADGGGVGALVGRPVGLLVGDLVGDGVEGGATGDVVGDFVGEGVSSLLLLLLHELGAELLLPLDPLLEDFVEGKLTRLLDMDISAELEDLLPLLPLLLSLPLLPVLPLLPLSHLS